MSEELKYSAYTMPRESLKLISEMIEKGLTDRVLMAKLREAMLNDFKQIRRENFETLRAENAKLNDALQQIDSIEDSCLTEEQMDEALVRCGNIAREALKGADQS